MLIGGVDVFQSTLPRRERHLLALMAVDPNDFNPRSHAGSDFSRRR